MSNLIDHYEAYLGITDCGWKDSDGTDWPFQVGKHSNGPIANANAYVTAGLSHLALPSDGKMIRHELLFLVRKEVGDRNIPALLHQLGVEAIASKTPYLRGDVIGPRGLLVSGYRMEAIYVSYPVYLPDSFAIHQSPAGFDCVIAWLIPISASEATFIKTRGWELFENVLCEKNPDFIDLNRPDIV